MSANPIKIVIVNDEQRSAIGRGWDPACKATAYSNPQWQDALDLLQQEPMLTILDRGLPDVPVQDLLRKSRARNDGVPILVLSIHRSICFVLWVDEAIGDGS
jgi:DNA-binding response OmpR family regulator